MIRVWLDGDRLIVAHRYGGCYGVVTVGNTGVDADEELSELPPGAVELTVSIDDLIERSSLGTPGARRLRARTSDADIARALKVARGEHERAMARFRWCWDCGTTLAACEEYRPDRKCCPDCRHRASP